MKSICFTCGTEFHLLVTYILSVTVYADREKILCLVEDIRIVRYIDILIELGIWDKVIIIKPDESEEIIDRELQEIARGIDTLHFFSLGYPLFNKLFFEAERQKVKIILTDEGIYTYMPFRRYDAWINKFDPDKKKSFGFNPKQIDEIWLFDPLLYSDKTIVAIKKISMESFYSACESNKQLVINFKRLFLFAPDNLFNSDVIYFRQNFSLAGYISTEADVFVDEFVCAIFSGYSTYVKDHPGDHPGNIPSPYVKIANQASTLDIPWEALLILTKIDASLAFKLPKIFISPHSSAMFKTISMGIDGSYIFTYKLIERYTDHRDETINEFISLYKKTFSNSNFYVPQDWQELQRQVKLIAIEEKLISNISMGNVDMLDIENVWLREHYIEYWKKEQEYKRDFQLQSQRLLENEQRLLLQVNEKDQMAQRLLSQINEKDQIAHEFASRVIEIEQKVQALTLEMAEKDRSLFKIKSSKLWKIVLLLRRIPIMLVPPNSLRARAFHLLNRIIFLPFIQIWRNRKLKKDLILLQSSNLFDANWYLVHNPDVAEARIDATRHYLLFGGFEGRDPGPDFSSSWYLEEHKDVQAADINPLVHFLKHGAVEGRAMKPSQSMEEDLVLLRSSALFNENWYLAHNSDVVEVKIDAAYHYLLFGGLEGRDPGPDFSSSWYLAAYNDVKLAGVNPLVHFLKYGQAEGRTFQPGQVEQIYSSQIAKTEQIIQAQHRPVFKSFRANFNQANYILKTFGLVSLLKAITQKLKTVLLGIKPQPGTDFIVSTINFNEEINLKKLVEYNAKVKLQVFLKSDSELELPIFAKPLVSIILLFYNRAEVSLQCLETLTAGAGDISFEVVIVDNASTDKTSILLERLRNVKIIRNSINHGFGDGCNQAVDLAVGKYLLFLNNDTQLTPNSLKIMVDTFDNGMNIGAVGGKLIFPDGRLQEAGSIVWRDGSCQGYGRFEDPFKSEFSYVKDVDFCSGALLITPRDLFLSVGGFDSQYAPAYYEDADYCLQLWDRGYRVVFQPFSIAIHHEFGSSKAKDAIALQIKNREKFLRKWKEFLKSFDFPDSDKIIFSRERKTDSKRILFIDDMIPDYHLGSGYPRTYRILHLLAEMGYKITFFPLQMPHLIPEIAHSLQLKGVEVLYAETDKKINFEAFIKSRSDYYDIAFVSRPHNMHEVIDHLKKYAIQTAVVYDAEALFSLRDVKLRELNGRHITETEKDKLIQAEVSLVKDANVITTVSKMEKGLFLKYGISSVQILGHVIEPNPTPATFEERKDILFVGGILSDASPNADAVRYFINQILPLVRQKVNCDLYVVGTNQVKTIWDMESDYVHIIGRVNDLTSYYNRCRLFVVPTRYSAGIPLKLLEAAAHGVPAVVTPLTADQLGWQENRDFLVGATPKDFASKVIDIYSNQDIFYSLRQNALDRIREEYSPEVFSKKLVHVLNLALHEKEEGEISALIS